MTAAVLNLRGDIPLLHPRVSNLFSLDEDVARMAQSLIEEGAVPPITVSNADDPQLGVPTVLLFSSESWGISRSSVALDTSNSYEHEASIWHDAFPTAEGGYLLVPNVNLFGVISSYKVTRDEERSAYAFHVGTMSRQTSKDEVVWEEYDNRCHFIRYADGALQCLEVGCDHSCGGQPVVDDAGVEHLPCGCPQ